MTTAERTELRARIDRARREQIARRPEARLPDPTAERTVTGRPFVRKDNFIDSDYRGFVFRVRSDSVSVYSRNGIFLVRLTSMSAARRFVREHRGLYGVTD